MSKDVIQVLFDHQENEIKARDPIRCRECGYRIMYKKRTKRLVVFDARWPKLEAEQRLYWNHSLAILSVDSLTFLTSLIFAFLRLQLCNRDFRVIIDIAISRYFQLFPLKLHFHSDLHLVMKSQTDIRMRPLGCELSLLSRADGSASFSFGDETFVIACVYGPTDVRISKERIDKATVEVWIGHYISLPQLCIKSKASTL